MKMSHYMPSTSWRTREVGGIIQTEAKGLRTMCCVYSLSQRSEKQELWCLRAGKDESPSSKTKRGGIYLSFAFLFFFGSIWAFDRLATAYHIDEGRSSLFNPQNQMLVSSRNEHRGTSWKSVLPATVASLSPVTLTHKINHHTPPPKS